MANDYRHASFPVLHSPKPVCCSGTKQIKRYNHKEAHILEKKRIMRVQFQTDMTIYEHWIRKLMCPAQCDMPKVLGA